MIHVVVLHDRIFLIAHGIALSDLFFCLISNDLWIRSHFDVGVSWGFSVEFPHGIPRWAFAIGRADTANVGAGHSTTRERLAATWCRIWRFYSQLNDGFLWFSPLVLYEIWSKNFWARLADGPFVFGKSLVLFSILDLFATLEQCSGDLGWLLYIEDYTTHLYGDCNKPL